MEVQNQLACPPGLTGHRLPLHDACSNHPVVGFRLHGLTQSVVALGPLYLPFPEVLDYGKESNHFPPVGGPKLR